MIRNGPTGGSVEDLIPGDTLAIGTDTVALDAFGGDPARVSASTTSPTCAWPRTPARARGDYESLEPREDHRMRIANLRIVFQVDFVLLFLACLYLMAAPRVQGYVVSVFLEADPLVALTTMLSTGHLYHVGPTGLWLGIGLLVVTILIGRAFCGWVCPFGALHHFMHWLGFPRPAKKRLDGQPLPQALHAEVLDPGR